METQVLTSAYRNHGNFQVLRLCTLIPIGTWYTVTSPRDRRPYRSVTKRGWFITALGFYTISTGQKQMASAELWTNPSLSDCPGVRFSIQISESQGTEGTAKCNQSFQICTVYMGPYNPLYMYISMYYPPFNSWSLKWTQVTIGQCLGFKIKSIRDSSLGAVSAFPLSPPAWCTHLGQSPWWKLFAKISVQISMCPVCHKLQAIIVITAYSSIRVAFRMSYTSLEVHLSGGSDIHRLWHFILFTHLVSSHLISPTSIINQVFVDINGNSPIFFFTDFPAVSQIFKGPVSMGPTISCTKVFICSLSCTTWKTSLEGRRDRLGTARTPKYLFFLCPRHHMMSYWDGERLIMTGSNTFILRDRGLPIVNIQRSVTS